MKLVKTGQVVSEKTTLKDYRTLYLDIAQWQGQIIHGEQKILIVTKKFYYIVNFSQRSLIQF